MQIGLPRRILWELRCISIVVYVLLFVQRFGEVVRNKLQVRDLPLLRVHDACMMVHAAEYSQPVRWSMDYGELAQHVR